MSANAIRIWIQRSDGDPPPAVARSGEQLPLSAAERQERLPQQINGDVVQHRAYFSPSWTPFQSDRGRCFSGIVDDGGGAQVIF